MNREEHLRQTLPQWLKLPRVAEVVIVDWSNRNPLVGLCELDPRIRVIRVENEPRWVLSYAYNVGVAHATGPTILKCDADCLPASQAVDCVPGEAHFFAGYWKSGAAVKKPSVNGQCIFTKAQFAAVNGYSEFIRTYGRDDEDFYDRMIAAGFARREIPVTQLDFLDHTHEARVANQFDTKAAATPSDLIARDPLYNEMRNSFLARQLPWNRARRTATYATQQSGNRWTVLTREKQNELSVSTEIEQAARLYSLRYIVSVMTKITTEAASRLDERACLAVISARLKPATPAV
jgi:hypothetical protein